MQRVEVSSWVAWFAVVILLVAYGVSFLDRQILTLLVQPIKADLNISDTQMGVLQGPAFALFYVTMGLPLGWLADRVHRVRLIASAIGFWSLMTIAAGFSSDYWQLVIARFGVGMGEAALVPAAVSLLSDFFKPERRALPISIFTCGLALGSGLALVLGGAFIAFAQQGVSQFPIIGPLLASHAPWQVVFILAGLSGLPVAASVLLLVEPRATQIEVPPSLQVAWSHLVSLRKFFLPMLLSMGGLFVLTNSLSAWLPSVFIRDHGWGAVQTGYSLGLIIMISALFGNISGGIFATALQFKGVRDAVLRTMIYGAVVMIPAAVVTVLLPSSGWALAAVGLLYFSIAFTFGIASLAFVEVTPPRLRGQVVSLYLLVGNLLGLMLGPTSVGVLIDTGITQLTSVGGALAIVCLLAGAPSLWLLFRARAAWPQ